MERTKNIELKNKKQKPDEWHARKDICVPEWED